MKNQSIIEQTIGKQKNKGFVNKGIHYPKPLGGTDISLANCQSNK